MESVIKDNARDEFYDSTCGSHSEKDYQEVTAQRFEDPNSGIKAQSVYRTKRTCQKASVDKLSFGNSVVDNFNYPAHKAVDEEHHI